MRITRILLSLLSILLCLCMLAGCSTPFSAPADDDIQKDGQNQELQTRNPIRYDSLQPISTATPTVTSSGSTHINLSGYTVVALNGSAMFTERARALGDRIEAISGIKTTVTTSSSSSKTIVIGTLKECSDTLLAASGGAANEFVIRVYSQKIVIAGANDLYALLALDYFVNTYLGDDSEVEFDMPSLIIGNYTDGKITVLTTPQTVKIVDGNDSSNNSTTVTPGTTSFKIVYSADLDDDETYSASNPLVAYGAATGSFNGDDYIAYMGKEIQALLNTRTGTESTARGKDSATAVTYEILLGSTSRTETQSALGRISPSEAIVAVIGNKIVATGHNLETQRVAAMTLFNLLKNCYDIVDVTSKENNVTTTTTPSITLSLPADLSLISQPNENWLAAVDTDLPELPLNKTANVGDDSLLYLYMGSGVNLDAYNTYCDSLLANGYVLVTESTLKGSYFKTFANYTQAKAMQVSYNAFGGAAAGEALGTSANPTGISSSDPYFDEEVYPYTDPQIRIITTDLLYHALPDETLLSPMQSYTKVTESSITILDMSVGQMYQVVDGVRTDTIVDSVQYGTGFVMLLEDGSFLILDGGAAESGMDVGVGPTPWAQADNIWSVLRDLHYQAFGTYPSESNPVRISAWIISHSHGDHYDAFYDFSHKYGGGTKCSKSTTKYEDDGVTVKQHQCTACYPQNAADSRKGYATLDYLITNLPAASELYHVAESSTGLATAMPTIYNYFGGFTHIKPHTGQTLYIANAKIETLFTHEDLHPHRLTAMNDTSTINRITLRSTAFADNAAVELDLSATATNAKDFSFIATGDLFIPGSRWLCAMYGSALKADMLAVAHHGGPGAESAFYDNVSPSVLWWPNRPEALSDYLRTGVFSTVWLRLVDRYIYMNLGWKYCILADTCNSTLNLSSTLALSNLPALTAAGGHYEDGSAIYGTTTTAPNYTNYSSSYDGSSVAIKK